jgi:hypothetical protein
MNCIRLQATAGFIYKRCGCTGEGYNTQGDSAPKYNFVHSCVRITPNLERKIAHFLLAALQAYSRDRLESVILCYDNTKLRTHARTVLLAVRPAYKSRKIRHYYRLTKKAHRTSNSLRSVAVGRRRWAEDTQAETTFYEDWFTPTAKRGALPVPPIFGRDTVGSQARRAVSGDAPMILLAIA